ncbi:MAG: dihydropteroate synthase-like protein [Candidatus Methanomethylicia archaeon]
MKVLLVTGLLAEEIVKRYAGESSVETEVLALKVPVAALLNVEYIAMELKKLDLKDFDIILIPGLVRGDASIITNATGIPTFKGPKYAADLPMVLNSLGKVKLSPLIPACDILRGGLQESVLKEFIYVEDNKDSLLKKPGNMLIGGLAVGKDFPMRVMAEIVDAPLLSINEIKRLAKRYVNFGAEIIDIGMIAGESRPVDAEHIVRVVKSVVDVPVSIDTFDSTEIEKAVNAGADLILSVDAGNVEELASFASEIAVVVIPTNQCEGYIPKKVEERVTLLEENIGRARSLGFKKVIGDLILEPINVFESLKAFYDFSCRNPYTPLLMGISNVTELMDVDSIGVNALLTRIASEIGVNILLVTEKSDKCRGSVREVVTASKMMFLAKRRSSAPKDLGIDLLILKNKRIREEPYNRGWESEAEVILATEKRGFIPDTKGFFKIFVYRDYEDIVACYFINSSSSVFLKLPEYIVKFFLLN